ncbi:uncharacterized protein LOC18448107 [Amborella trichopoda]|nr:uncharacterized protein LOC18448107 [Amborella trichopoda]|eukprot:XP_006858245.2 uncharacterized protein LOC18448107 [Amborella trichopoda]
MAGLLAWAADVVGGGSGEEEKSVVLAHFTAEQQRYLSELDERARVLSRSIEQLRLRLPPSDISQRLPHLHAHSKASNAALALQLNAHSATRQHAQLREASLQEENTAYEKAISVGQNQIQEKLQEADALRSKLKEMELNEKHLICEMEKAQATWDSRQNGESSNDSANMDESPQDGSNPVGTLKSELENKKQELRLMEEKVRNLETEWAQLQHSSVRQPTPAQREKILEKQLQSLTEQLAAKQAQAELLVTEIHKKEIELENLIGMKKRLEIGGGEAHGARNRVVKPGSSVTIDSVYGDHSSVDMNHKSVRVSGDNIGRSMRSGGMGPLRFGNQEKLILLRFVFVLYILALHFIVFIKISFL